MFYVRPSANAPGRSLCVRTHDERGMPVVWIFKVLLYGECDASAIFHRTLRKQLAHNQSFVPWEMDSCYFIRMLEDGSMMEITAHVDDLLVTDSNSELTDKGITQLHAASPIKHSLTPEYFLGSNLHVEESAQGRWVCRRRRISSRWQRPPCLTKPLESNPKYTTTASMQGSHRANEEAVQWGDSGDKMDPKFVSGYGSRIGNLIFVVPSSRVDCAWARALKTQGGFFGV